ncbi:MAG: nucleotidyl transferase AbiEii/AbiGii toxin family protein [bacterium]
MLNIETHRQQLSRILLALISDKMLAARLGFKGGTALYFFEELPRFSTDLDFDLIGETDPTLEKTIRSIVAEYLTIVDEKTKRFTWFWQGSYGKGEAKIKVEVNTRKYPNYYETRDWRGYGVKVMVKEDMLAHKLCAITDRKKLQNRDLYDAWWMLKRGWEANEEIIQLRTDMKLKAYWKILLAKLRALPVKYDVLAGLGEVMSQSQKDWVKAKLRTSLELELASRL